MHWEHTDSKYCTCPCQNGPSNSQWFTFVVIHIHKKSINWQISRCFLTYLQLKRPLDQGAAHHESSRHDLSWWLFLLFFSLLVSHQLIQSIERLWPQSTTTSSDIHVSVIIILETLCRGTTGAQGANDLSQESSRLSSARGSRIESARVLVQLCKAARTRWIETCAAGRDIAPPQQTTSTPGATWGRVLSFSFMKFEERLYMHRHFHHFSIPVLVVPQQICMKLFQTSCSPVFASRKKTLFYFQYHPSALGAVWTMKRWGGLMTCLACGNLPNELPSRR